MTRSGLCIHALTSKLLMEHQSLTQLLNARQLGLKLMAVS